MKRVDSSRPSDHNLVVSDIVLSAAPRNLHLVAAARFALATGRHDIDRCERLDSYRRLDTNLQIDTDGRVDAGI